MRETILVTGGYGFIGSSLIRTILDLTNFDVINIDKLTYAASRKNLCGYELRENYSWYKRDICNQSDMFKIISETKPTKLIHLAAESHVDKSIVGSEVFMKTNICGTHALLEASRKYFSSCDQGTRENFKFVHVSTDEVYGDLELHEDSFSEASPYNPSSPYAASKAASDHLVRAWNRTYNLPTVVTNCSNNYGPFQFEEKLIPVVISKILNEEPIPIYGSGNQIRDWLHVDDHTSALLALIRHGRAGETYNIGARNEYENLTLVRQICEIVQEYYPVNSSKGLKSYQDLISPVKDRPGHDVRYSINPTKLEQDLNWGPKIAFSDGLRDTVKWYIDKWSSKKLMEEKL